jgi:hypothetical protein
MTNSVLTKQRPLLTVSLLSPLPPDLGQRLRCFIYGDAAFGLNNLSGIQAWIFDQGTLFGWID